MKKAIFYSKSWKLSLIGLENMLYLAENFWLLRMFPDLKNYIYGLISCEPFVTLFLHSDIICVVIKQNESKLTNIDFEI